MKKLFVITIVIIFISACSTTKEAKTSSTELRNKEKLAEQVVVKKAVESRRFAIRLDRLYYMYGGTVQLVPKANYIIIDGNKAIINAAYLGRQYEIKPITGINVHGETKDYELTNKLSKGKYEIKTKVSNGINSFDLYLSIENNGSCNISLSNVMIDKVSYTGYIVPLKEKTAVPVQKSDAI
jgi:hypothetical protein